MATPTTSKQAPTSLLDTFSEYKELLDVKFKGKTQLLEIRKSLIKQEQEEKEISNKIQLTEEEMCDLIARTRKATKFLISQLPRLDKADENRLDRAAEPVPDPENIGHNEARRGEQSLSI